MNEDNVIKSIKKWLFKSKLYPLLDKMRGYYYEGQKFYKRNGYELNLKNPRTFNEKVVVKKLHDRNPLLFLTGDKYNVKNLLLEKFGEASKDFIIPTLFSGKDYNKIPFESLPEEYIVKGCHLSGDNLIVTKDRKISKSELISHCRYLLTRDITIPGHAWFYKKIPKRIIIEPLLRDEKGKIPQDFKFFCFSGKVKMFQVDFERSTSLKRSLFNSDGDFVDGRIYYPNGIKQHGIKDLKKMIEFVEGLTFNLDFVRVDIYIINDRPIFGELTHYPGAGYSRIFPYELDLTLGNYWQLGPYFNNR